MEPLLEIWETNKELNNLHFIAYRASFATEKLEIWAQSVEASDLKNLSAV